jgi:AcrR family transcriptional regulator
MVDEELFGDAPRSIRHEQKEETRGRILESALALIGQGGDDGVTIRAVAARAGVTERTVFRYFENREALLLSIWRRMDELLGPVPVPQTADALIDQPRRLFKRLDFNSALVRAYLQSRAWRRRMRADRARHEALSRCVEQELPGLNERNIRRRAAIAAVITSPSAWDLMQESCGFSGSEAAEAAAEGLEILLDRRDPTLSSNDDPWARR